MAQALLSNLNNLQNSGIYSANMPVAENIENSDFETILNIQTENLQEMTEIAIETIGSIKDELAQEVQTLGSIIKDTIAEIGAENALDLTLDELSEQITEEECPTETEIETETQLETENSEENNSTITNEEPTMQKEILENPTAGLILTSQTQLNQHSSMLKEENNTTSQNTNSDIKFVSTNSEKNLNTMSKEVLTYSDAASKTDNTPPSKAQSIIDDKMAEKLNIETVETESGNNGNSQNSSDLMKNQTPEEQGVKAVIQGEVKYEEISLKETSRTVQSASKPLPHEVSASRIIDQIAKQMNNINTNSKVSIVLNPESLGKVVLQLVNSKEGLTALFTVTTQDTKNLLSNGLDGLKETLLSQGVSVDNISIKLSETESEYNPDWTEQEGSRGGNKGQQNKRNKENQKAFEQTMFEINNKEENV